MTRYCFQDTIARANPERRGKCIPYVYVQLNCHIQNVMCNDAGQVDCQVCESIHHYGLDAPEVFTVFTPASRWDMHKCTVWLIWQSVSGIQKCSALICNGTLVHSSVLSLIGVCAFYVRQECYVMPFLSLCLLVCLLLVCLLATLRKNYWTDLHLLTTNMNTFHASFPLPHSVVKFAISSKFRSSPEVQQKLYVVTCAMSLVICVLMHRDNSCVDVKPKSVTSSTADILTVCQLLNLKTPALLSADLAASSVTSFTNERWHRTRWNLQACRGSQISDPNPYP